MLEDMLKMSPKFGGHLFPTEEEETQKTLRGTCRYRRSFRNFKIDKKKSPPVIA